MAAIILCVWAAHTSTAPPEVVFVNSPLPVLPVISVTVKEAEYELSALLWLLCSELWEALFTIVCFSFNTHTFYYGYAFRLHYSGVFNPRKWRLSKTLQTPF